MPCVACRDRVRVLLILPPTSALSFTHPFRGEVAGEVRQVLILNGLWLILSVQKDHMAAERASPGSCPELADNQA